MSATVVRRRLTILGVAVLTACGGQATAIVRSSPPPRAQPPAASAAPSGPPAPYQVWVRQSGRDSAVAVVDSTGHVTRTLPLGVHSADWSRYYTVGGAAAAPVLTVLDPGTGANLRTALLPPYFDLPAIGPDAMPEGLSPNGRHLVVTAGSSFLVLDAATLATERRVNLSGDFSYDGLSDDGTNLFLIEVVGRSGANPQYHVRRYDLGSGALDPNVVVDKTDPETVMSGLPLSRVISTDGGWQYTVYAFGGHGPFVHALNLAGGFAACIDLPRPSDDSRQLLWSLAASRDGAHVFAVNGTTRQVTDITTAGPLPHAARIASFGAVPVAAPLGGSVLTADAKEGLLGGAVLSADGRTLYAVSASSVLGIDVGSLTVRRTLLQNQQVNGLALAPDGRYLLALLPGGDIMEIPTAAGAPQALLRPAVTPFAILRVVA